MSEPARRHRVFVAGVACAAVGALIGAVSLLGWLLDDPLLRGAFAAGITVKTNTSIALFATGVGLLLLAPAVRPRAVTALGRVLGGLVGLIGLATLFEHATGIDLGIDQLLFREATGALGTSSPNRMGIPASLCFTLLGPALIALDRPERRERATSQVLAVAALVVCLVPLLGYILDVRQFYGLAQYTGIALQTALGLAALALGTMGLRPHRGFVARIVADDAGALLVRRLLPAAVLLPIAVTWIRILGEGAGFYDRDFGRVLLLLLFILLFTALIWWTGAAVTRQEAAREEVLREADRRKNVFLATLAHELRNPLAPVWNAVQILRLPGTTAAETRWAQALIERQVAHLTRLIDDLLDVSRIAYNKLELRRSRTTVAETVGSAVESCRPSLEESGHALTVSLPPEPLALDADPVRLVQVFSNLLTNAIKYTPPGGRIVVEARRQGHEAVVRVADTGVGIAPAQQGRLFEMFFQAEGDPARAQSGLGIGLALVRHLVELHGGRITATSAGEGQGSAFEVRLPLAQGPDPAAPAAETQEPGSRGLGARRILVVDDNLDAAETLGAILRAAGAEVALAHDGEEALALALASDPEIVILDLGLPRKSGHEVAEAIRAHPRDGTRGPVLIALTGWGQDGDRARSQEVGFDHHLVKPVGPEALLALIAGLDGGR
jgi:signal transduction histidine kinase